MLKFDDMILFFNQILIPNAFIHFYEMVRPSICPFVSIKNWNYKVTDRPTAGQTDTPSYEDDGHI